MQTVPRISTYKAVTNDGELNPFADIPRVSSYGNDAADYHAYMLAFHANMPVFNDFTRVHVQLLNLFRAKRAEWDMYMQAFPADNLAYNQKLILEETHTVHDGMDETAGSAEVTDKENTYDTATMKDTRGSETTTGGSVTYGHEITVEHKRYPFNSPVEGIERIIDMSDKMDIFSRIIDSVIEYVSCKIYLPEKPSNN